MRQSAHSARPVAGGLPVPFRCPRPPDPASRWPWRPPSLQHPAGAGVNDMSDPVHHAADQGFAQAERGLDDGFGAPPVRDWRVNRRPRFRFAPSPARPPPGRSRTDPCRCGPDSRWRVLTRGCRSSRQRRRADRPRPSTFRNVSLLAGKGQVRQVLGGGGGAHRHTAVGPGCRRRYGFGLPVTTAGSRHGTGRGCVGTGQSGHPDSTRPPGGLFSHPICDAGVPDKRCHNRRL